MTKPIVLATDPVQVSARPRILPILCGVLSASPAGNFNDDASHWNRIDSLLNFNRISSLQRGQVCTVTATLPTANRRFFSLWDVIS